MEILKIIIFSCYVFLIGVIVFFNWLYSVRTIRANKKIGLYVPQYIKLIIRISNVFALITIALIGFFLMTKNF